MVINSFSVIMSIVLFTIASTICSLFLLRSKSHHIWIVTIVFLLCALRCLIPVEINGSLNVNIWTIYPDFFLFIERELFRGIRICDIICIIWFAVSAFLLIRQINSFIAQIKFIRIVRLYPTNDRINQIAKRAAEFVHCSSPVEVYITPLSVSPIMTGIFHPVVLIPKSTTELNDLEIEYVLRHEIAHYKGGDIWYKLAIQALVCILWWNPAVYLFRRSVSQLFELRCDNRACMGCDQKERNKYSSVLLKILENALAESKTVLSSGFIGNFDEIYSLQRIKILTEKTTPKRSPAATTLIAFICVLLYLGSYSFIIQPAGLPPEAEDDSSMIMITPENSWLIPTENGRYEIWFDGIYLATISADDIVYPPYNELPIYEKGD